MQANLLDQAKLNTNTPAQPVVRLTRDAHGMCARSEAPLCIEGQSYVLEVYTRKVHSGVVTTRAVVVHRDEQGFSTHRVFQDYNRCVFKTEHKRVTEKVIAEQHTQAIKVWDTLLAEATAHTKAHG